MLPFQASYNSPTISWDRLARALTFYEKHDYTRIEVPWIITPEATLMTWRGTGVEGLDEGIIKAESTRFKGDLPGSAEQSFLQLAQLNALEVGRNYVTLTPCFRCEDVLDEHHQRYFMKVELFALMSITGSDVEAQTRANLFLADALRFFTNELKNYAETSETLEGGRETIPLVVAKECLERRMLRQQTDLYAGGLEIGSYGYTSREGYSWAYGTGLAEPRFSQVELNIAMASI